jgi:uncharacterized protein
VIPGFDKERFKEVLYTHLSPTTPVQSQENLRGREPQMREIEQALCSPGRSVFIYGERGVGKSSLAQTVAYAHQSAQHEPVILACEPRTTFAGIMTDILHRLADPTKKAKSIVSGSASVGFKGLGVQVSGKREPQTTGNVTPDMNLNAAVQALSEIAVRRGGPTVVVIDEFDRIGSDEERTHFADLIKQVGDQQIGVRFIFCGVADSLDKLLGAHESCFRYLVGILVARLPWEARWEIIDGAAAAFGITVSDHPRFRIAAISDGFPHFVHLVSEKLFWEMLNDEQQRLSPSKANYQAAVGSAVQGIEQHLKRTYDKATIRGSGDYEQVLWAVADHGDLIRNTDTMFQSYVRLAGNMEGEPLDRNAFVSRLSTLKTEPCGRILTSERRGWYQYREGMMRGYVRLRAEEQGIELETDYAAGTANNTTWRQRGARRAFRYKEPDDIYEN